MRKVSRGCTIETGGPRFSSGTATGDRRGGSHTAFLFDATLTFDEALAAARERWPRLFERFTFEVVPEAAP